MTDKERKDAECDSCRAQPRNRENGQPMSSNAAGYDVYFVIQGEDGRDTTAVMEGFLTEEAAQAWIDVCGERLAEAHIVPR